MHKIGGVPDHQTGRAVRGRAVVRPPAAAIIDAQIGGHDMEPTARVACDVRVAHTLFAVQPLQCRFAGGAKILPVHAVATQREIQLFIGRRFLVADEMHENVGFCGGVHGCSFVCGLPRQGKMARGSGEGV